MVKSARETGVNMTTDLINQIIVEWKFQNIVNCHNGREDTLENRSYKNLKLAEQIMKNGWLIYQEINKKTGQYHPQAVWWNAKNWK